MLPELNSVCEGSWVWFVPDAWKPVIDPDEEAVQLNKVPVTSELKFTAVLALPEQIVWLKLMEPRSLGNGSTRTT